MDISRERLGLLFALVGPGGVGKNTLMNRVLGRNENLHQLPTATTRPIRQSEQHGREHLFLTQDEFQRLINQKALLEYQEVRPGQWYGMPRTAIEEAIDDRRDLIADIEVYGATILRNTYPENALLVFIAPISMQILADHMRERGSDEQNIADRMKRAEMEMTYAPTCDYLIVSDSLDDATEELYAIITNEQRGQASSNTPLKTSYSVRVSALYGSEMLTKTDTAVPLMATITRRESPQTAAFRLIADHLGINPAADDLTYQALDHAAPVQIHYDPAQAVYNVTYHYVYTLTERVTVPTGYTWKRIT